MTNIDTMTEGVKRLMDRLDDYQRMIDGGNFETPTIDDMKGNAKNLCDVAKGEIDNIKSVIDAWS